VGPETKTGVILVCLLLAATSQAAIYTWDGGAGNWEDSKWNGGGATLEGDGSPPSASSYDYVDDTFIIGPGANVTSSERVTLTGGALVVNEATFAVSATGNRSGFNLGQTGGGGDTVASFTNSAVTITSSGGAGRALYLKNDAVLDVINTTLRIETKGSNAWIEVDDGVLTLIDATVTAAVIRLDGTVAGGSRIEFRSGRITLSSSNAFRGNSLISSMFTVTGEAGDVEIIQTDNSESEKELAYKVHQGLFWIDDTRILVTTVYNGTNIAQINNELGEQVVNGRYFQMTDAGGQGTQRLLLTSTGPGVYNPSPADNATHEDPSGAFGWDSRNATSPLFDINIGTDTSCSDVLSGHSTGSATSYASLPGLLDYGTQYYWRVDIHEGDEEYPGRVWSFTTGGNASNPVPRDGGTIDRSIGTLGWTGDGLAASYDVYFGYPGQLQLVGGYADTSASLNDLATALSVPFIPAGEYQWRVDTRDATGSLMVVGEIWTVVFEKVAPIVVEDFYSYFDDTELMQAWSDGGANGTGADVSIENSMAVSPTTTIDVRLGVMTLNYSNTSFPWTSQARRRFSPAVNWTRDGMDTLSISFMGDEGNDPEPMYVSAGDGSITVRLPYGDGDATTDNSWKAWTIKLHEFSDRGLDLANITELVVGFGNGSGPGGSGTMRIDDIMLHPPRCLPEFVVAADINCDCSVDFHDLMLTVTDWLDSDYAVGASEPGGSDLLAHYQFEEITGTTAHDSSGSGSDAIVEPGGHSDYWDAQGHNATGCLKISDGLELRLPAEVFADVSEEVTICMWMHSGVDDHSVGVENIEFSAGAVPIAENTWDRVLWDIDSSGPYASQWNHYAAVKNADIAAMKIYRNGVLVSQNLNAGEIMDGGQANSTVLSTRSASAVRIDDLRIYGAALSHEEIVHLLAGPGGQVIQPIEPVLTTADNNDDGRINFGDFAELAVEWLREQH